MATLIVQKVYNVNYRKIIFNLKQIDYDYNENGILMIRTRILDKLNR